jgi:23S rRNA (guanine2445-N2)-methyltransferase / 23S rRNA (guanine2069-N7)-methyltransferase
LRIADEASGKHFLNLYCYTGVATLHAALGGAHTSTSVDLSNTYLNWFRENLALNGLSERQHRAVRADCLSWLGECDREFDLILLDPPSFSNSKSTDASFDVARDQLPLIDATMAVLARKGVLYFSNNKRGFALDPDIMARYHVEDISKATIPEDFKRKAKIHQCWKIQHR